jgi:hypothetical protein
MWLARSAGPAPRRANLGPVTIALAVAAMLAAATASALELVVEAPSQLASAAAAVRALGGTDLGPVLALTGLDDPGAAIRVVLADERSDLATRAPSWVAGYALPALATIVLFPARVPSYPDRNLEALLVHEVAHVLVYRAAAGKTVPRWLDEGLATVAAREWALEDRARTAVALIGYRPHSVAELDDAFSGDASAAARAYALSAALVRYLLQRYGRSCTGRMLALVAGGAPFEEAFRQATGVTLAEVETAYFRREAFWGTWVPFVTSSTALWIGITALALLAIRSRRRRDAEIRERWVSEDAATRPAGRAPDPPDEASDPRRWN